MEDKFVSGKNVAFIGGGGGSKCFGGYGVLCGFAENFGIREPAVFVACSGMNVAAPNYVLQRKRKFAELTKKYLAIDGIEEDGEESKGGFSASLNKFYHYFTKKKAIRKLRLWKMIDLDIVIEIFRKQGLLRKGNLNRFFASPVNYITPTLDAKTGDIRYFSNRDEYFLRHKDEFFLNAIRGGMNLFFGSGVGPFWDYVDVMGHKCIDSILTSNPKTHLEKVVSLNEERNLGIKKIVMIDHDFPKDKRVDREELIFEMGWLNRRGDVKKRYCEQKERAKDYFENVFPKTGIEAYTVELKDLPISTISNSLEGFSQALDIGYNLTLPDGDKELRSFLRR